MNERSLNRGLARSKFLTAVAISALFLGSSPALATGNASTGTHGVLEQMQTTKVKVTVMDQFGPVVGANVIEKGTTNGAITDLDGNVNLEVSTGATLVVSFVGYTPQEVKVTGAAITVTLKEDTEMLDEVVVVGYGTQKKVNLTGAVANVNVSEAIASRPVTDVAKALQGISPGLSITNNQGGVGTESNIRLRGSQGSLNASSKTTPLILVDNVEVPSLNLVNPDDIESISVLKDAASASIYGTRAAWGVILITTKQGKQNDKVRVSYSNNFAWQTPTILPELSSAVDNATAIMEVQERLGVSETSTVNMYVNRDYITKLQQWQDNYGHMSQSQLGEIQLGRDVENINGKTFWYRPFDAVDMFTKKWTPQQQHNLSVTGGSDKTTFNISLGYMNQSGVMKFNTDEYDRYTLNSNITTQIRDWWKVRTGVLFTRSVNEQPYRYTSGYTDVWYYLLRWPTWYPYGTYEGKDVRSAVTEIKQANREAVTTNYVRTNLGTTFTPIKGLDINFDYTFSLYNTSQHRAGGTVEAWDMFGGSFPLENYNTNVYGDSHNKVVRTSTYTMTNVFKAYATYNFDLDDKHNFKTMIGFDAESREKLGHYSEGRMMITTTLPEINLTTGNEYSRTNGSSYNYHNDFAAAGFFGRINYDYMGKYLLEFNARYDGSSRFPSGKKFGFFPSFSAGWRASEEAFMGWAKPALSDLKVRGSWGTIGNQDVASNAFISTMSSGSSGWIINGVNQLRLGAPSEVSASLTWERVTTLDLGFDARFFDGDFGVTFDWYQRRTSDMHTTGKALPLVFGAAAPEINYGELTATGWELAFDYSHQFDNGLGLNVRASLSHVSEEITKWNDQDNSCTDYYKGKKLGEIWGYETEGLFQSDAEAEAHADQSLFETGSFKFGAGDVKYKDLNGDGVINNGDGTLEDHGDWKVIGNSLPDLEYGITLGLDYKGFDFSTYFQGVGKRDYWGYGNVAIPFGMSSVDAIFEHQLDYWTPDNTDAFYPRPANHGWVSNGQNFARQSRYLSDMSYLRCKNITVGYTIPADLMKKIDFQSLRVFFSAENVFCIDNMHLPIDPETTSYKGAWAFGRSYPYMKTISFGVQAVF